MNEGVLWLLYKLEGKVNEGVLWATSIQHVSLLIWRIFFVLDKPINVLILIYHFLVALHKK